MTARILLLACLPALLAAQSTTQQRLAHIIDTHAHPKHNGPAGYATIAARLYLHEDAAGCSAALRKLLATPPNGDMFWMFPAVAVAELDQGQLEPSARKALRDAWRTYAPYRGDTENHWLLYYTSLYLMSELYPDDPPESWFTGKSSKQNREESKAWIESWIKLTTSRGQGEYDSPHYMAMFNLPVSYLAGWAKDPLLKKRAAMMLDYLAADYAAENLDGTYVGAQSRVYDDALLDKATNITNEYAWYWFGIGNQIPGPSAYLMYYAMASRYDPPEVIRRIATDRSTPYTHYERKRTRNRWRFNDELHGPVYKTTYVRREYAVGSDQGGILQPIQQHSWDVTWSPAGERGKHNTLFFLNPHSSIHELQTYFVFASDTGVEDVVHSKKMYDSPEKFSGGSPYEKIAQDRDTIVALYDIPMGARFGHINGFFSKDLAELREQAPGWLFARGGGTYIACRVFTPYMWKPLAVGGKRLFSPYRKTGVIVQAAAASEFADLDSFAKAILALPLEYALEPTPMVRMKTLRGATIEFTYGQTPRIDGAALDYAHWPLFGGPFLQADVDSQRLVMRHGDLMRTLDFVKSTVADKKP